MAYLLDTGILLRFVDDKDALHASVQQAVELLVGRQEELYAATQNIGEFWNVATRPAANNGLGLPPKDVLSLIESSIEPVCGIMLDSSSTYTVVKRLLNAYAVVGKQVHDARLVALMLTRQIDTLLTLNPRDFRRYESEGIIVVTPSDLAASS
jgi:predicted nucleic acid-binding protein